MTTPEAFAPVPLLPYEQDEAPQSSVTAFDDTVEEIIDAADGGAPDEETAEAEESAEGEGDEGDDDSDEDDDEESEDGDEDDDAPPQLHKFKADGREHEVPYEELVQLASKGVAFRRKTEEVAQIRKQAESVLNNYSDQLAALGTLAIDRLAPHELHVIEREWRSIQETRAAQANEGRAAWIEEQTRLVAERVPEWVESPELYEKETRAIVAYAEEVGISQQEFEASVNDHRLALVFRDAMRYREMQTKGKAAIRAKIKTAKVLEPGGRSAGRKKSRAAAEPFSYLDHLLD